MATCCNPSGGPATYPDALAALESASMSGIRAFRFFASLFGDANKLWVHNARAQRNVECLVLDVQF